MRRVITIQPSNDGQYMRVRYNNGGGEILNAGTRRYNASIRLMRTMERVEKYEDFVFYRAFNHQLKNFS